MTKTEIRNNYSKSAKPGKPESRYGKKEDRPESRYGKREDKPFNKGAAPRDNFRPKKEFSPRKPHDEATEEAPVNTEMICGRNSVLEALRGDRPINKVLIAQGQEAIFTRQVKDLCKAKGVPCQEVDRTRMDRLAVDHRGVVAYVAPYAYKEVGDMIALAAERNEAPLIIILAEVEDPHNLGAVIRTAECAGAHGIIIPKHRAVPMTETVSRVSAGAAEYVPVARVANLVNTMKELKDQGIWIAGAHMTNATPLWQANLSGPLAIVLGSEGEGIPRLVAEHCDFMVKLPMKGKIGSLNVSATASVLLYEVMRQRNLAAK